MLYGQTTTLVGFSTSLSIICSEMAILAAAMGEVVVFANQKGGVGKTTTAVNLGAYLALAGRTVLLVDFDPQGNLSSSVGHRNAEAGMYEVLMGEIDPKSVIGSTDIPGLDILPSTIDLSGATVELVEADRREYFLKSALDPLRDSYDYLLIDSPPSLGLLTINGLAAADKVLIPLQCEYFALEGLTQLLQSIEKIQRSVNQGLEILGIVFTMYDSRTRLAQDVVQEVVTYFGRRVFRTIIPRNVRLSEAPSHGVPIHAYDPECAGAKSYAKLAEEVLQREQAKTR
jgi:chromosome partitioning protein